MMGTIGEEVFVGVPYPKNVANCLSCPIANSKGEGRDRDCYDYWHSHNNCMVETEDQTSIQWKRLTCYEE